jgi:hypothetical protein
MTFDKETQKKVLDAAKNRLEGKKPCSEEEQRIFNVMDMHPEMDELWNLGELASYPQEINGMVVNPFVHTVLHLLVDLQIKSETPEYVENTFARLQNEGMEEHEALHAIIEIYADLYFSNFRKGGAFSYLDYQSRLGNIAMDSSHEEEKM